MSNKEAEKIATALRRKRGLEKVLSCLTMREMRRMQKILAQEIEWLDGLVGLGRGE